MAEFAKKTVMGYKPVSADGDPREMTHVILTMAEYQSYGPMVNEVQLLRGQIQYAREYHERLQQEVYHATQEWNRAVEWGKEQAENCQKANENAKELVKYAKSLEKDLSEGDAQFSVMQERLAYWKGLNENLLRISRERANACRKLIPKKKHTGFVVCTSTEKYLRYTSEGNQKTVVAWETIIQTPYSCDLAEEYVRELLEEKTDLLQMIGIEEDCRAEYKRSTLGVFAFKYKKAGNMMMEWTLRANYIRGYWEWRILHTKPLGAVPEEMRPAPKQEIQTISQEIPPEPYVEAEAEGGQEEGGQEEGGQEENLQDFLKESSENQENPQE